MAALTAIVTQIHTLDGHITALLAEHTDAHIFLSLPRAKALRAARLLAEIGDCRGRFPTPESLASLAGTTPSTRQSGKLKKERPTRLGPATPKPNRPLTAV